MKKIKDIIFITLVILGSQAMMSQTLQTFRKYFETDSGIYGYVDISTKPITVGAAYIWIQQDDVVVEGVRGQNGRLTGYDISSYGVTFPFRCNNCYFFADGTASMLLNGTRYYANFEKGGSVHKGGTGKTNSSVLFSREVKDLHNDLRKKLGYSLWESTGQVERLNIYGVTGADFGKISDAKRKYEKKIEDKKMYDELMSLAKSQSGQEKLETLNRARQYTDDTSEIDSEIRKTEEEINNQSSDGSNKSNLNQESDDSKDNKSEDKSDSNSENESSENNNNNDAISQVKNSRTPDLSSEKAAVGLGMAAAAAVLASEASRFGLGARYNGTTLTSIGPEVFLMFSPHFGANLHYGFARESESIELDGFDAGLGFFYDFFGKTDGIGIGMEALYTRFEKKVSTEFREGTIISLGGSINLYFIRFGYTLPLSVDYYVNDKMDFDYDPGGTFFVGLFMFF